MFMDVEIVDGKPGSNIWWKLMWIKKEREE